MGALVAAVAKDGEDVIPDTVRMLNLLKHRGRDEHGIATGDSVTIARNVKEFASLDVKSNIALGHNFSRILQSDLPQPVQNEEMALVFEGRLFPSTGTCDALEALKIIGKNPLEEASRLIKEQEGSYAFAFCYKNRIVAGRDPVGVVPLYYGENDRVYALASERKALWGLNIENVKSFPTGNLAITDSEGLSFETIKTITKPPTRSVEDIALDELHTRLFEAVGKRAMGLEKVAVAFSGGLDSSLTAALAKECNVPVLLISVGLENQPEMEHAEYAAKIMGLPFKAETFTLDDVERVFSKVLWLIEEPDMLKASVAIPFFWAAEAASKWGHKILLAGQGCDELFGGYHRYLSEYRGGNEALEEILYRDTFQAYEVNYVRDNKVCAFHNVELRLPFTDYELISFALSLPPILKIASATDPLRKRILRKLASDIGLPPEVYNRPKKAVQYGTGVHGALKKLAKKRGQKMRDFIRQSFCEIKWDSGDASVQGVI